MRLDRICSAFFGCAHLSNGVDSEKISVIRPTSCTWKSADPNKHKGFNYFPANYPKPTRFVPMCSSTTFVCRGALPLCLMECRVLCPVLRAIVCVWLCPLPSIGFVTVCSSVLLLVVQQCGNACHCLLPSCRVCHCVLSTALLVLLSFSRDCLLSAVGSGYRPFVELCCDVCCHVCHRPWVLLYNLA